MSFLPSSASATGMLQYRTFIIQLFLFLQYHFCSCSSSSSFAVIDPHSSPFSTSYRYRERPPSELPDTLASAVEEAVSGAVEKYLSPPLYCLPFVVPSCLWVYLACDASRLNRLPSSLLHPAQTLVILLLQSLKLLQELQVLFLLFLFPVLLSFILLQRHSKSGWCVHCMICKATETTNSLSKWVTSSLFTIALMYVTLHLLRSPLLRTF